MPDCPHFGCTPETFDGLVFLFCPRCRKRLRCLGKASAAATLPGWFARAAHAVRPATDADETDESDLTAPGLPPVVGFSPPVVGGLSARRRAEVDRALRGMGKVTSDSEVRVEAGGEP